MKSIMVDMDDVMTYGNFDKMVQDFLGYKPDYSKVKGYYVQNVLGDRKDEFFALFKDKDMYENATLLPDCYDVLKQLSKQYEIYIVTDYIWPEIVEHAGNNLRNKYNFLYKELDFIKPQNYIFASDKSVIKVDIKIDDRVKHILGAETKLLFDAYHNKEIPKEELDKQNIIRVHNWKEIGEILLKETNII